jgi:hypothetical protein
MAWAIRGVGIENLRQKQQVEQYTDSSASSTTTHSFATNSRRERAVQAAR